MSGLFFWRRRPQGEKMFWDEKEMVRQEVRARDIGIIFRGCPQKVFKNALELGGGDGFQSRFLQLYACSLTVTDRDQKVMNDPLPGIQYRIMDLHDMSRIFPPAAFDLIFSSNVLEHVPRIASGLAQMERVLQPGGLMIHVLPTGFWKFLQYLLFGPVKFRNMLKLFLCREIKKQTKSREEFPIQKSFEFFPASHGGQVSSLAEFYYFSRRYWQSLFEKSGFEILSVKKLQFHSPYHLGLPFSIRSFFSRAGFSSAQAYIMKREHETSPYEKYFGVSHE